MWAWVAQAETDAGERPGLTVDEHAELARLRRGNWSAAGGRGGLETGDGFLCVNARIVTPGWLAFFAASACQGHGKVVHAD